MARTGTRKLLMELTDKERAFVLTLAHDPAHNKTKAAVTAGYSERSAPQLAARLMTRDKVRAAYEALLWDIGCAAVIDASWLVCRMAEIVDNAGAKDCDKINAARLIAQMIGADQPAPAETVMRVELAPEIGAWEI